jgi:hypothetical protein
MAFLIFDFSCTCLCLSHMQVLQNFVLSLWSNATEAADAAGGEVHAGWVGG